jgi:hypothetical protein
MTSEFNQCAWIMTRGINKGKQCARQTKNEYCCQHKKEQLEKDRKAPRKKRVSVDKEKYASLCERANVVAPEEQIKQLELKKAHAKQELGSCDTVFRPIDTLKRDIYNGSHPLGSNSSTCEDVSADESDSSKEEKKDESEKDESEKDESEKDESEKDESEKDETEKDESEKDESEKEESDKDESEKVTLPKSGLLKNKKIKKSLTKNSAGDKSLNVSKQRHRQGRAETLSGFQSQVVEKLEKSKKIRDMPDKKAISKKVNKKKQKSSQSRTPVIVNNYIQQEGGGFKLKKIKEPEPGVDLMKQLRDAYQY